MAKITYTPGAYTREIDLSFSSPQAVQQNIYGLLGFTLKGPAFLPTKIDQYSQFQETFGSLNTNFIMPYAAKSVLKNGTSLLVTRVLGTNASLQLNQYTPLVFALTATTVTSSINSLSGKILGILRFRDTISGSPAIGWTGTATAFTLSVSGVTLTGTDASFSGSASGSVTGLSIDSASPNYIYKKLGTNPRTPEAGDLLASVYLERVFPWYTSSTTADDAVYNETGYNGALTATTTLSTVTGNILNASNDLTFGDFREAVTPYVVSQNYNGVVYDLFKLHMIGDGTYSNTEVKVSISDIVPATSEVPASFTVTIRLYKDKDSRPVVVESFKKVTLIETDKNYIGRVIGDTIQTVNPSTGEITETGNYQNNSKYVYVEVSPNIPFDAQPSGFKSIQYLYPASGKDSIQLPYKRDQLLNGDYNTNIFMGPDYDTYGSYLSNLLAPLPLASAAKQQLKGLILLNTSETSASASLTSSYSVVALSSTGNARDKQFTVPFFDGWDGIDPNVALTAQQTSLSGAVVQGINILSDKTNFDFDVFAMPGITLKALQTKALTMIEERADAYLVMDLGEKDTSKLSVTGSSYYGSIDSSYAGGNFPWIKIYDEENDTFVFVTPSVGALEVLSFNDKVAFPWFAAAGENRGTINSAVSLAANLTESDKLVYQINKINPLTKYKGKFARFGQNTLQRVDSALGKENVRRLLIKTRKIILAIAQKYAFEPSTPKTWDAFISDANAILEDIQTKQGINFFKVIMDETTNTPEIMDRNEMYAKIALQPTRSGEIFLIDFFIQGSNVTFDDL